MKTITDILEYLNALILGAEITDKNCKRVPLDYYCSCFKDTFRQHLRNYGATTLKQIAADVANAGVELTCPICTDTHHLAAVELEVHAFLPVLLPSIYSHQIQVDRSAIKNPEALVSRNHSLFLHPRLLHPFFHKDHLFALTMSVSIVIHDQFGRFVNNVG
ncbi:hypothetical protein PsorP6_012786 [Peronosclerospora sorghi]|uniref:Uncharacterized protein n=1 Tax=Peronosclerospora sorghi TaxID=230839 RepID=A0ACC0WGY7_9STRA|nr:hypothetical protein PsorP6_012786 [Peronosclerospora sorghi]